MPNTTMSISYYAVPVRDASLVGGIVEESDTSRPIDQAAVRDAVRKRCSVSGGDSGTLKWESGNDYVFVDVLPTHVLVTHNAGRGSYQVEVVMEVLHTLSRFGLHVYDPQRGDWFPS